MDRLTVLEEFARAYLSVSNIEVNFGEGEGFPNYNTRVMRLRKAVEQLPIDLFDEVEKEDSLIYKDV